MDLKLLKDSEDQMQEVLESHAQEISDFMIHGDNVPNYVKAYLAFSLSRFYNLRSDD